MGWVSHLEYFWAEPSFARFLLPARVVLAPDPDRQARHRPFRSRHRAADARAADGRRARGDGRRWDRRTQRCIGVSEGGPMCALFAATYPRTTRALVMIGTYAKRRWDPGLSVGADARAARSVLRADPRRLGRTDRHRGARADASPHDPAFRDVVGTYLRMGASPGAALRAHPHERRDRHPRHPAVDPRPDARPSPPSTIAC